MGLGLLTVLIECSNVLLENCKCGNIHYAKYSRFQPYEVFCGNTFAVPWPAVFVIYVFTGKLMILLKTVKTAKV